MKLNKTYIFYENWTQHFLALIDTPIRVVISFYVCWLDAYLKLKNLKGFVNEKKMEKKRNRIMWKKSLKWKDYNV